MPQSPAHITEQAGAVVLLATHNGAPWLEAQLDSLLSQDAGQLHIVARDDASTDTTPEILEAFRTRAPANFTLLDNPAGTAAGIHASFAALLKHALTERSEPHILFCDQDDLWYPDKLSSLLPLLQADPGRPALAYAEMRVVDDQQQTVADTFSTFQNLSPQAPLARLLVQNHVSGCASLFNRAALELACPLPAAALMHDWWLALVTACVGELQYYERPLQDYRQHGRNAIGAEGYSGRYLWRRASGDHGTGLAALYRQAATLETRLLERGFPVPAALASFLATRDITAFGRWRALRAAGHTRNGLLRNLPLWLGMD